MSKSPKFCYLDFEFNRLLHESLNLVSCVVYIGGKTQKFWLHKNPSETAALRGLLSSVNDYALVSWAAVAEARALYSLGLDPTKFTWVDLMLDYKCLLNHNDDMMYGKQLVEGVPKSVSKPPPKWERTEEDSKTGFKPTFSLAEATYKLCGVIRDTKEKDEVRNLIISDPDEFTLEERERILKYNADDVVFLEELHTNLWDKLIQKGVPEEDIYTDSILRGRFAAITSLMEAKGYPLNYEAAKNFSDQVPSILLKVQQEINSLFPEIKPFRWDKKYQRYAFYQKSVKDWIRAQGLEDDWLKTETGDLSLALEAFTQFFDFKHDYPEDNFGAQMVRFLKLKQSLYGFVPTREKKRKTFWDFVGPDKRVRPYMNIYGAQSGRSQPSANGFMFLKPAWMRSLVLPPRGSFMVGVDYASQEFFLSALLSEDWDMINAYLSGDVYLAFGKQVGIIPPDGTKAEYKAERDLCKSTVLGLSYLMSKYGLAIKLTQDTGKEFTEDEAQEFIDLFYSAYPKFAEWQSVLIEEYKEANGEGKVRIFDGWYMWGDNNNHRSVANVPVQGLGAAIMREACHLATSNGIYIPFTLHDALYAWLKSGQEHLIQVLIEDMRMAFAEPFSHDPKLYEAALQIRLDPFAWGPDLEDDGEMNIEGLIVPTHSFYLDERAVKEFEKFKQYFEKPDSLIL